VLSDAERQARQEKRKKEVKAPMQEGGGEPTTLVPSSNSILWTFTDNELMTIR
jgi:hypothetical protein